MKRIIVLTVAMIVVAAACGLPNENEFQPIDRGEDGFGLSETSTTSTTTTVAPTTTLDVTTSTIAETTTTIATEQVDIYFPTGRLLTSISVSMPANPALTQVMAKLLEGPPDGELGIGLRAVLPPGADITVTSAAGVASVDLPSGIFDSLDSTDQRLMFGQIVLTLTGCCPGVGPVVFTLDGQPTRVFRGDGSATEPGEAVSRDDYTVLLTGVGEPIETTSTAVPPSGTDVTVAG
jgi:Sporulation and spore germination